MNWAPFLLVASLHAAPGYETLTPGIGVRSADTGVWAVLYRNSIRKPSVAVGWQPWEHVVVGGVTGYSRPVIPLAGLTGRVGPIRATLLPPWKGSPTTVTFSYEF